MDKQLSRVVVQLPVDLDPVLRLQRLGETSAEVARALEAGGFVGFRSSPVACPLCVYLISYGWTEAYLWKHEFVCTRWQGRQKLPEACVNFLRDFDAGLYPSLDLDAKPIKRRWYLSDRLNTASEK